METSNIIKVLKARTVVAKSRNNFLNICEAIKKEKKYTTENSRTNFAEIAQATIPKTMVSIGATIPCKNIYLISASSSGFRSLLPCFLSKKRSTLLNKLGIDITLNYLIGFNKITEYQ